MKYPMRPKAVAKIQGAGAYPQLCGEVRFFQHCDGTVVEAEIKGLPRTDSGFFAFHIHEGGRCTGEAFSDAGSHFNPGAAAHPNHAGDLPPLLSDHGKAYMKVFTDRFCVQEVIGKTVIVHAEPDDFRTQPAGNAGNRIACGEIKSLLDQSPNRNASRASVVRKV